MPGCLPSMAEAEETAETAVSPRPARMSLSQMKVAKLQKQQRLAKARSADAMWSTSQDFMDVGARSGASSNSTPIRRTVSFSDETPSVRAVAAGSVSDPGKRPAGVLPGLVFNSRGEVQVSSDDSFDSVYEDGETHSVLRASSSLASTEAKHDIAFGDRNAFPVVAIPPTVATRSLESPVDVARAARVGMVQSDWMAVADSRYAQKCDIQRCEVRPHPQSVSCTVSLRHLTGFALHKTRRI